MHSLLNYASSDDEDAEVEPAASAKHALPSSTLPAPSHPSFTSTTTTLDAATSSSSLSLPPPAKGSTKSHTSRATVLSALASSLSALHSSASPFATSLLDPALSQDTTVHQPPTQSQPTVDSSAAAVRRPTSTAVATAVEAEKARVVLPSAAALLAGLPSDSAEWERRTGGSGSHAAALLDRSQFNAMPLPASLRPPASESDAFRFMPHQHTAQSAALRKQPSQTAASTASPTATAAAAQSNAAASATTQPDNAVSARLPSKQAPSAVLRFSGQRAVRM